MGQCPNCGKTTSPDQATCASCGTPLGTAAPNPPTDTASEREQSQAAAGPAPAAGPTEEDMRAAAAAAQFIQGQPDAGQARPAAAPRDTSPTHPPRSPLNTAAPAVSALVLGLAIQWLIATMVPADAYLHRLFRPQGGWIMSIVPGLIIFVFIWTVTDLFIKSRVGRSNDRDLNRSEVKQLPFIVGQEPMDSTLSRLRGWDQRLMGRPVGRRVVWLLHHLSATPDIQRVHELARHQSDLDADATASGYRTVTLFIWAMPILGFVGTVLGISLAVGGFSDFLTTSVSIDEIDSVTAELGNVASGLSFAFDTTLLGLLAGLVSSVISSGVKEREERLLTGLDELGLRIMESVAPLSNPAPQAPATSDATRELQLVYARLDELSAQMQQFAGGMRAGLEGLNQVSAKMSEGLASSLSSVRGTVEQLGLNLESVSGALAGSLSGLSDRVATSETEMRSGLTSLEDANKRLEVALANTAEQLAVASTRLREGVESQASAEVALGALSESIDEFGGRLSELRTAQEALAPTLRRLAGPLELRLMPADSGQPGD